ncbi:MAG: DUF4124 domain-containing protein [Pseudomonadales bacterium]|nr:DUF4124 domain-containing protein [Pseudomonadales bacterium]
MPLTFKYRHYLTSAGIAVALALGANSSQAAKYYKWVDDDGVTHYSAQPPNKGEGEIIKVKAGASSDKESAMKRLEERRAKLQQDAENRANPEKDMQAEADRMNTEANKKACETNKKNLKIMTEHSRVRMLDKDGQARVLPEEERQASIKKAKEFIQQNCQ